MSEADIVSQLQERLEALEQATKVSETDNVLAIQRNIVALERAKQIAHQQKMKRDIRSQIARSGQYNPESDPPYVFQPYPKTVRKDGRDIIVKNAVEERHVLGLNDAPAKTVEVDVAGLMKDQEVPVVAKPRGRPKKIIQELPPNLG